MNRLEKIGKSAEQLDYERDLAQLENESLFEQKLVLDSQLERWMRLLGFIAIAAVLFYIGLPSMLMAIDKTIPITWVQRLMVAGIGLIFWTGAVVTMWLLIRKKAL